MEGLVRVRDGARVVKANITLHEKQREIKDHGARFKVIKAGKRFGKTKLAVYVCIQEALSRKSGTIWYVAPTYGMAKKIAWWEFKKLCPSGVGVRYVESELLIEFGEVRVYLLGADNPDSLRGPELCGLILDEAAYVKDSVWESILSGQLISAQKDSFAYFISSPNATGRNWFSQFYDNAVKMMVNGDKDWAAFYFTIMDNPTLPKSELERQRSIVTDDRWELEYMAIESPFAGVLIGEFDYAKHVGKWEEFTTLYRVRGLDWGIDHPTVCLWGRVDIERKLVWIEQEFVKSGYLIHESCKAINELGMVTEDGRVSVDWSVIDPSTKKRNSQTGRSDLDEFIRYGVYCIAGDNSDRGIDIMKMFFKTCRIKINPQCKNLINEIRTYQRGDKDGDDCLDALRYMLVRIHDIHFGGSNFFEESAAAGNTKVGKNEYSIYDKQMFRRISSDTHDYRFGYLFEGVA